MQDVVIIGAGLAGLFTAQQLLAGGARVVLLERGTGARESSWAGGGILSPLYPWRYPDEVTALSQWSQSFYPDFCDQLHQDTGIDPQYTQSGLLMLDRDKKDTVRAWQEKFTANVQQISSSEIQALEPTLTATSDSAYWMPEVAQVRNPRLLQALTAYVRSKGAKIKTCCEVTGFLRSGNALVGVSSSRGEFHASDIIVTAGAWSGELLDEAGFRPPPVEPVRGQMLLFKTEPGQIQRITLSAGHYVIPRRDGRVLVGSTMEYAGFDKTTTNQALNDLQKVAVSLYPVLEKAEIEMHWAGLRPGSTTGVPYIGQVESAPGLYVNTGHFRNGVVMGPASARKVAEMVLQYSKTCVLNYT